MTDLASLGIRVESQEVAQADGHLDNLTAAATRAETATDRLAAAARGQGAAQMVANTAIRQQAATLAAVRGGMGLTAAEGLNLSRQMTDVGVQMAMGMSPFLIAVQQGPQIFDIFQQSAIRTGTTVTAAMRGMAVATWTAMAPFLPLIAAAGAAAALIGGSLALSTRALNREFGDLTEGMGLTEKQLEKVQNRGVTMGDVITGTLHWIGDTIWNVIGPAVIKIGEWFSDAMDWVSRKVVQANKVVAGTFIGSFRAIKAVWGDLPAVIGDLAVSAANVAIRAIEGMINKAREGLNSLITFGQFMAATNPAFAPFKLLSPMDSVSLGQIGNGNAGAARRAGREWATEYAAGVADANAIVDRNVAAWMASIRGAAEDRIRGEAGDAESARLRSAGGDRADQQARAVREELARLADINLQPLTTRMEHLVDPLHLIADELRLIDDLAHDTAAGLSSAFGQSGRALGDVLTAMSGYQSRLADINLAEREYRLSAVQAERERAFAQVQNYGDMAAAARGFFREGSDGYRFMLALEQVYRAQQLAGMLQSMLFGRQEAASSVANSMAKGAAATAAGAAKMFEALGPWAFPAVAAMLGLLAGLGLNRGGGGGGASAPSGALGNSAEASTAAVRAFSVRDAYSRDAAASAVAARVEVRVSADREGLNAYVEDKAAEVAAPMAAQAAVGGYAAVREERRQAVRRARQSFIR